MEQEFVNLKIINQGAPIVNDAFIHKKSENIVCIYIDLKSKYCVVDGFSSGSDEDCELEIGTIKRSIQLKEGTDRKESTLISFPDYFGWQFFATNDSRYTISVCLVKP